MNADLAQLRRRNLRTLGALAGLFMAPLIAAFVLYYGGLWRPAAHVNHGVLLTPPRALPALDLPQIVAPAPPAGAAAAARPLRGSWSLVYAGGGGCDSDCRAALALMRQTRLALGKDMTRVARVFLVTADCCERAFLEREHPGLVVLDASGPAAQPLLAVFPASLGPHTLYLVDPLGNLMMSYDAREDPHGLLADLKKLLRLSQIG